MVFGGLYLDPKVSPKFMHAYRDRMGYLPAYNAGENYDIIRMFAYAFGKAGDDGDGIRDVIATLKNFPTVLAGRCIWTPTTSREPARSDCGSSSEVRSSH